MNFKKWDGTIAPGVRLPGRKEGRLTGLPVIFAGPCMFESWEVGAEVAAQLKEQCKLHGFAYVFKSSYDKANRTSSNTMRGPGLTQGLQWLQNIKEQFSVPTLTDVHTPAQATEAGRVVDIVQIPAFLCQQRELLEAAAKTGKTVQIKKGQHNTAEQVVQSACFVESLGNEKVILCERGTSFGYNNLVVDYRNLLAMGAQGHKVCFDGTHAAQLPGAGNGVSSGLRHVIPGLVRAAVAIGVEAVFMEVHPNPEKALSDASTQLTPQMAAEILADIARICKMNT